MKNEISTNQTFTREKLGIRFLQMKQREEKEEDKNINLKNRTGTSIRELLKS